MQMNTEQVVSLVRSLLKIVGAVLVTKGKISDSDLELYIGAAMAVLGLVLSHVWHGSGDTSSGSGSGKLAMACRNEGA